MHGGEPIEEGTPIGPGTPWAVPGSPAATEAGPTFFSYSMQAGYPAMRSHPGPSMDPNIPLFGERNPWCTSIFTILGTTPIADGHREGNPWNHNREGLTLAFVDGRVAWLDSARALPIPLLPARGSAIGYDYVYDSRVPTPTIREVTVTDGRCPPVSPASGHRSPHYTSWLSDDSTDT